MTLTAARAAKWLATNVSAIAADESAGEFYSEIKNAIEEIDLLINRKVSPKYCGNCPAIIEGQQGRTYVCAIPLYAPWDYRAQQYPVEIQCWKCKVTYNVDRLIQQALNDVGGLLYSGGEIKTLMEEIGQPIAPRTWQYWRREGKIEARGWRGAEPMYWISDVQDLMAQKPQGKPTGSAAHKNKRAS
jgi:hypothetical protein